MDSVATIVDWAALAQTAAAALIAGVGIAFAFSVAIYGGTRFSELRRHDGGAIAVAAAAGLAIFARRLRQEALAPSG